MAIDRTGGDYNTIYAGIGAKGYDPVAYFTEMKAIEAELKKVESK